jgi:MFS family permease
VPSHKGERRTRETCLVQAILSLLQRRLALDADDLLRDATYRRLWTSILISSLGGQVTMLALPLTAAVLLKATPTQMGLLTAMEIAPFVLFSLPAGVWLDRVRKLPVYVAGEALLGLVVASVPLAWYLGWLSMGWMYAVGFVLGSIHTSAGSAAQIVLTQVVARERLVEAHARNALASSGAEVVGPGLAGLLIRLVGAPVALLVDAVALLFSAGILRGIRVHERLAPRRDAHFWRDLRSGLAFVRGQRLLVTLAFTMGSFQFFHHGAAVVNILFATRTLGLSEHQIGGAFIALGAGTVLASVWGHAISRRLGPGPTLAAAVAVCGSGWLALAAAPVSALGVFVFGYSLFSFGVGATLLFINFLALRQAVTPATLLGRMTATMRWLSLLGAGPGALVSGWLGEHHGLRVSLAFVGGGSLLLALLAWHHPLLRGVRELPKPDELPERDWVGAEADVRPS